MLLLVVSLNASALTGAGDSATGPLNTVTPVFSNLIATPNRAAPGDSVTLTFSVSKILDGSPRVLVNGHTAAVTQTKGGGTYTCAYLVSESDELGMALIEIWGEDALGNAGELIDDAILEIVEIENEIPVRVWPWAVVAFAAAGLAALLRRRRHQATVLLLAAALGMSATASAQAPSVSNVAFSQGKDPALGTKVDVHYDLVAPNGPCDITVSLSKDGGADGYSYPVTSVTGDLADVTTGTGKHIVWDIRADYPEEDILNARIRVTAEDGLPAIDAFAINGGAASTDDPMVTLDNSATNSPTEYMASESSDFSDATWQPYGTAPAFTLSPAEGGMKTVYFKVRNAAGESAPISDTINLVEERTILLPGDVPLELVWVPSGSFLMGRYPGELDSASNEDPQHPVTLAYGFWMGKYELTQQQWLAVRGSWPSTEPSDANGLGDSSPAYYVSWNDAKDFITTLNAHIVSSGQGPLALRLPSEAEWEYSCRAGTQTRFYWGDDPTYTEMGTYAWCYSNNDPSGAKPVGGKLPNIFGLYDMSGNVQEWCEDDVHWSYTGAPADGSAWIDSPRADIRFFRGGAFSSYTSCRSAARSAGAVGAHVHFLGFRLAADLPPTVTDFAINGGASTTADPVVTLDNAADNRAAEYMASEASDFSGATWQAYGTAPTFTLSSAEGGTKTVYFKVRNEAGESAAVSDTIDLTGRTVTLPGDVPLELVWVPGGTFMMGRYPGEVDSFDWEDPQHPVTLAYGFWMGKYEITQQQWLAVRGSWPGPSPVYGYSANCPAYSLSWNDAQDFITSLNAHIASSGRGPLTVRLPSEAEWEYACRAGTTTRFYFGDSLGCDGFCSDCAAGTLPGNRTDYLWYCGSDSPGGAKPVGGKLPNALGLHDMHGNIHEWCEDDSHYDYLGAPADGSAWLESPRTDYRMLKGSSYSDAIIYCRAACRSHYPADWRENVVGFRLAASFNVTSFAINGGAATTADPLVTLNNACVGSPTEYMASESPDFSGATWQPYATAPTFTLSSGEGGTKTVYFKVRNAGEESAPVSDTIDLMGQTITLPGDVPLELVWVPGGTFMMGRYPGEADSSNREDPQHPVTMPYGFWMGKYEITQQQWFAVQGSWPGLPPYSSNGMGDTYPVYYVSWYAASGFVTSLNAHIVSSGQGPLTVRLPSEAEWEYAARAGTTTRFYFGDSLGCDGLCTDCAADMLPGNRADYMWYCGNNSPGGSKPVGGKLPNAFGLYDMSGNVYEWCEDDGHYDYLGAPSDGSAWVDSPRGFTRVYRGGEWSYYASRCRSAYRYTWGPGNSGYHLGLRIAAVPTQVVSFSINGGAATTADQVVTLDNTATNSPTAYMASESSDFSGATWQPYDTAPAFTLSSFEGGTKTVYFKVRNAGGESAPVSDTIDLTGRTVTLPGDVPLELVWVPSGSYLMGRYPGEADSNAGEDPQHEVTLAYGFWMGKYEITQQQWLAVRGAWPGESPSSGVGDTYPAYNISWDDAKDFITSLNAHIVSSNQGPLTVRLPSEAEWEYASRAGTTTRFYFGDSTGCAADCSDCAAGTLPGNRTDYMWYCGNNSPVGTKPVGGKLPNAFGLYDMSGNMYEWCEDDYHSSYIGAPTDGSAWIDAPRASYRIVRSGCWIADAKWCRSAYRDSSMPDSQYNVIGFRLAAVPTQVLSFAINGGAATTTEPVVTLDNTAAGSPTEYMASESPDFSGAAWQPYAIAPSYTLSSGEGGTKTVYFKVRHVGGESTAVSDTIDLAGRTITLPGDVPLELVWVPTGNFQMGRYPGEAESDTREDPQHPVTLAYGFWMGKYEITQQQWLAVRGSWPGLAPSSTYGLGDSYPAYFVSWNDAKNFTTTLNAYIVSTSQGPLTVRLPSEAEWEYACRAGTQTRFYWGDDLTYTEIGTYAWYSGNNSPSGTKPVGGKLPNLFGLYDMSGNVSEWCEDDHHYSGYTGAPADGSAWIDSPRDDSRVFRGGPYAGLYHCRSAFRFAGVATARTYNIGFRLAALPTRVLTLAINGGAATTADLLVTLNNTATNSPMEYMASEAPDFSGATWQPYGTAPSFTLSLGVGARTVYFKVRGVDGQESEAASDTIFVLPNTVPVDAGTFTMGRTASGDDATDGSADELPQHEVTLGAYQIGKYEVTNKEYCDVLNWAKAKGYLYADVAGTPWTGLGFIYAGGTADSRYAIGVFSTSYHIQYSGGVFTSKTSVGLPGTTSYAMDTHPMVDLSWCGAVAFCNWLSEWQGLTPCYDMNSPEWPLTIAPPTPGGYRLPTEAEWERAAAWDGSKHWIYSFISDTLTGKDRANYIDINPNFVNPLGLTTEPYTSPAGWFNGVNVSPNGSVATVDSPSPVGAYDMSGNVSEMCHDRFSTTYYSGGAMTNPTGPATGSSRVVRGGSYLAARGYSRSAERMSIDLTSTNRGRGFRLTRSE